MQKRSFFIHNFLYILALYFLLQVILRVVLSHSLGLDEAEQMLLTQKFAWGYNAQPPLYSWIQTLFFKVFGETLFALALFKNILLFTTYYFLYKSALLLTKNDTLALIAAASLFLIPQIAWESQRALTHSILLTTLASITIYSIFSLKYSIRRVSIFHYTLLGALFASGFLAKYSFSIFIVALILSSLFDKRLRTIFLNKRIFITFATFMLLTLPHSLWIFEHIPLVLSPTLNKLQPIEGGYFTGIKEFTVALIEFLALMPIPLILFRKSFQKPGNKFLLTFFGFTIIILTLFILFSGATHFKDRWLQPFFFLVPLFIVAKMNIQSIDEKKISLYFKFIYFLMVLITAALIGRVVFPDLLKKPSRLNCPFTKVSSEIEKSGFQNGFIIAEDKILGGNMKLNFPKSTISAENFEQVLEKDKKILIVWKDRFPSQAKRVQNLINIKKTLLVPYLFSQKYIYTLHIGIIK